MHLLCNPHTTDRFLSIYSHRAFTYFPIIGSIIEDDDRPRLLAVRRMHFSSQLYHPPFSIPSATSDSIVFFCCCCLIAPYLDVNVVLVYV